MDKTRVSAASAAMEVTGTDLHRSFVGRQVLSDISVQVASGTSLAIQAPSGRGKSTLLALLGGFDAPDAGVVCWDGQAIRAPLGRRQRAVVSLLTQHPRLEPHLSLADNVRLAAAFRRPKPDSAWYHSLLAQLQLEDIAEQRAATLSGGQIIRAGLARSLLNRPRLLLADEPTGSLDAATGAEMSHALLSICRQAGITVIMASHDPQLIAACDQILELPPC